MKYVYLMIMSLFLVSCGGSEENKESIENEVVEAESNTKTDLEEGGIEEENKESIAIEERLSEFVPEGYKIVQWQAGNLNMDDRDDVILVIGKDETIDDTGSTDNGMNEEQRPLLVLIADENGDLKEVTRNEKVVLCPDCGGVMGDPFGDAGSIVIKNGYFSIESMGGSSDRWIRITTFKYDTTKKSWFLHKDGQVSWNTHEANSEEETVYSTKDFGVVPFEAYNYVNKF